MTERCKYADVLIAAAEDTSKVIQSRYIDAGVWLDLKLRENEYEYRLKPEKRTVRFYNYIDFEGNIKVSVDTPPPSAQWISEVQNVEL